MLFTGSKSAIPDRLLAGDDLPEGWEWTSLQSLVNWRKGKKPDGLHETPWPGAIPYIDIQAFENGNIRRYTDPSSSVLVDPNDVIVVWDGARCGYVGKSSTKGALGSTLAMLKPVLVESDYLLQFLQSRYETINSNPRGTGIPHVEPELFWNLKVPLAPLVEQKRIMAKVEQLLARVNAARERLAKVPAILKCFRQSVLAAACSGRLAADWRDRHGEVDSVDEILKRLKKRRVDEATTPKQKNRLKEIYSYREKEDPRLIPENWTYVALDKLCGSFQYGTSRKSQSSGKVPVLRMGNIQDGHIDWNNLVYTSDDSEIQKYRLDSGSVLFNRTNSPELVGKTGIYRGEQPAVFAGYLIRIKNFDDLNSEYLNYCLNSNHAKEFCLRVKTDGVSQSNINAQKLGKFEVPFCSLEEQQEIVRRLGALFRVADRIEARYQKAEAHVEKLTQAILAKAFRGELVPTEAELARREGRNYEPASMLLERIKVEREALEEEKRSRKGAVSRRRRHRKSAKEAATKSKRAVSTDTSEGAKSISTASDSSSHGTAIPPVSNRGTPAMQQKAASITAKKHRRETFQHAVPLSDLKTDEVMAVFRKACQGPGGISREDLFKKVSILLGYQRLSSGFKEPLKGHLRAAIRRKIIGTNGNEVWLETKTTDDYECADLVSFLGSVMRLDTECDREEVIWALANYLGFRRLTDGIRAPIKSAINSAIRQGNIVGSRSTICRIL